MAFAALCGEFFGLEIWLSTITINITKLHIAQNDNFVAQQKKSSFRNYGGGGAEGGADIVNRKCKVTYIFNKTTCFMKAYNYLLNIFSTQLQSDDYIAFS